MVRSRHKILGIKQAPQGLFLMRTKSFYPNSRVVRRGNLKGGKARWARLFQGLEARGLLHSFPQSIDICFKRSHVKVPIDLELIEIAEDIDEHID
jgi:hypothetical protein